VNKDLIEGSSNMFEDIRVIGEHYPEEIATMLEEIDDTDTASKFIERAKSIQNGTPESLWSGQLQPWEYSTHQFGYIAPLSQGVTGLQPIQYAGAIRPDDTLKNSRINIRIDRLCIYRYPGGGKHNVILAFGARNQVADRTEEIGFSQTYRVPDGQIVGISGYPVFIGLNVGSQGIS
jgi:hypothetical protein